jgi:hypothetical protein
MNTVLSPITRDEAYRIAMKELGELFGEYLIQANNEKLSEERRKMARARANACQQAIMYFREN